MNMIYYKKCKDYKFYCSLVRQNILKMKICKSGIKMNILYYLFISHFDIEYKIQIEKNTRVKFLLEQHSDTIIKQAQ